MLFCKMRVQRYCFFLNIPNFFVTFAAKLTYNMRFGMKKIGFGLIAIGVFLFFLSLMVEKADNNSTRLVGLVLVVGGAFAHVYGYKKKSKY